MKKKIIFSITAMAIAAILSINFHLDNTQMSGKKMRSIGILELKTALADPIEILPFNDPYDNTPIYCGSRMENGIIYAKWRIPCSPGNEECVVQPCI